MKKHKGFTLIELLAIIVILTIVLAIAVPSISSIVESSTESAFESDAKMVLQAVKYKQAEDESFNYNTITIENMQSLIGVDGSKYKQVTFEKEGELKVILVGDKKWNGLTAHGTIRNMIVVNSNDYDNDTIPPVITLIGDSSIDIYKGTTYTDAGATATDNKDEDISDKVTVTSNLNISVVGSYIVEYNVTDNNGNAATPVFRMINVLETSGYVTSKGVNGPVLAPSMTPIKWDGTAWVDTIENDTDWYNYTSTDKQWANARTADGSMWVWIPRYIYKISSGWHSTTSTPIIDIQFTKDTNDNWNSSIINNIDADTTANSSKGTWTNHPAFTFGDTELTGIWVAKFEASGTSNAPTFIPNVSSLRSLSIDNMFTAARNMETNSIYGWGTTGNGIDTHMMKNVEWGVAVYLAQSVYGKNAEVWINQSSSFMTGCAGTSAGGAYTSGCVYNYATANGQQASTTGNVYGIYDMSGGAWEHVAAYVNNTAAPTYGNSIVNADSKYKDVYEVGTSDTAGNNYAVTINKKGDAIYESSASTDSVSSWYTAYSYMIRTNEPWCVRGGTYGNTTSAGIFAFHTLSGAANTHAGFRTVLSIGEGL